MTQNACEFPPSSVRNRCEINANLGQFAPVLPVALPLSFTGVGRFKWWSWGDSNPRPRKAGRAFREVGAKLVRISPWAILAVALTACGGGGSSAPAPGQAPTESNMPIHGVHIIAFGDSTQAAQGNPHASSRPGWTIENKGISGSSTAQWVVKWSDELAATKATHVIYNGGLNDGGMSLEQYKHALRELVRITRAYKKQIILEQPNNAAEHAGFDLPKFNERRAAMGPLASAEGVYFCSQPDVPLRDGPHPTDAGYATKATRLAECIGGLLK